MRGAMLLLILLAALASPAPAAQQHDFAVGVKDVLGHEPKLPGKAETRRALKDILARPEFHDAEQQTKGPSLLDRLLNWIMRHFGGVGKGLMGAGITTLVIAGIVVAAILILLVYIAVRAVWARMSRVPVEDAETSEVNLSAGGFRELARKTAARGDYLAAVRYRFRAVVGELDMLDPDRQTNWQLLRHVRRMHNEATADFAALISLFEDCWYGQGSAGAAEFARADQLAAVVEKALLPREAAA